jgi:hypothetical protein
MGKRRAQGAGEGALSACLSRVTLCGCEPGPASQEGLQRLAGRAAHNVFAQDCLKPARRRGVCAPAQVWSTKQPSAVAAIDLRANVCCAKYNPARAHEVAVGCADHNVHLFDLRSAARPVHVFTGARAGQAAKGHGSGLHLGKACVCSGDMQR